MWPYVAMAMALLGAVWWMPVRVTGRADINRVPTLHLDCRIWKLRLAYDAVVERKEGSLTLAIRRRGSVTKPGQASPTFVTTVKEIRSIIHFFRNHPRTLASLRRGLRWQKLGVSVRVGAGDAAHTALLHGLCSAWLQVLARLMHSRLRFRPTVRALSDYRTAVFLCSVDCIIAFHLGDIIRTAFMIALESIARRQ